MADQVPKLSLHPQVIEESLTPSALSGKKRPNTHTLAADLCNSQFLKMSCVGADGKTPRSISITAAENRVLRMPDSGLMFKQQRSLQDMLTDIYEVCYIHGPDNDVSRNILLKKKNYLVFICFNTDV